MNESECNCSCGAKLRFVRRDKVGDAKYNIYECVSHKCRRTAVERTNLYEEFSIEDLGDLWGTIFVP